MTRDVITVTEDLPGAGGAHHGRATRGRLACAARREGGWHHRREDLLLGFGGVLGAFEPGVRVMLEGPDEPGVLASIGSHIQAKGGNVVTFAVFRSEQRGSGYVLAKVRGVKPGALADALNDSTVTVLDVREMGEEDLR